MRAAFRYHCLRSYEERKQFEFYSVVHIDWKWEFLSKALNKLVPLLGVVSRRFSAELIGDAVTDLVKSTITTSVAAIFAAEPFFAIWAELYRVLGSCIEHFAKKLETCWCHEHIWNSKKSYAQKRKRLLSQTGRSRCVWKGKMGPWWVCVGIDELLAELGRCTSETLDLWISQLPVEKAGLFLRRLQGMRSRIVEVLQEKLSLFRNIPWKAMGGFWGECGGILSKAKTIIRECLADYDHAVLLARPIHRFSHYMFRKGSLCIQKGRLCP